MGGKKNGKKKKKEIEEKDVLSEVDKEFYEIQLADLNKKLSRLRNKTSELETFNFELEENLKKLDEDRSDVIAYLKKTLKTKTNELVELQERFDGLKQTMESGVISYKEKIAQMEQEYKSMQDELTSDNKLLMGKLNSLEEFRTQKEELTAKFATQEKKMEEQEKLHKENLYQIEKNFILEKIKLKKQMEAQLLQLSLEFQKATDIRIAATTHKTIKENIAINNELTLMQQSQKEMIVMYDEMKEKLAKAKSMRKLHEEEKKKVLCKNLVQIKVIEELLAKLDENASKIQELTEKEKENNALRKKLAETEQKLSVANAEVTKISSRLANGQANAAKLYADIAALKLNSRRLYATLHRAVNAVKDALIMPEDAAESEEIIISKRHNLLNNLLQILNRAEMSEKERYLTRKISYSYKKGDLGFIPKDKEEKMIKEESKEKIKSEEQ